MMKNALSGLGLSAEAALVTFPMALFLPGSDIEPIRRRRREFYEGLTAWKPERNAASPITNRIMSVEGATYEETFVHANNLFITNLWSDGLPLYPPTVERVAWILRGAASPREQVLGKFPPRGAIVTIESCAIALAMAGGRPEYLPVLVSAVEAFLDPRAGTETLQAASGSAFPVVIVNGPIGKRIRLSSSFGCLGPDPQLPAGASIGRALRLMQQNLGGALPGVGSMANYGAMRYTNVVMAEDDEGLPEGWPPHGTERHGYAPGTNSVSLVFANGAVNIRRRGAKKETPEEEALQGMHRMADFMRTPNVASLVGYDNGTPGILILPQVVAHTMTGLGWTKQSMRAFLWEHSKIPAEQMRRSGSSQWVEIGATPAMLESLKLDPWPISAHPDNLVIVCAGGDHPTNSFWLQGYCPSVIGREIQLPAAFDALIADANRDLGCGSEVCML
ncbi:MAG: hypothetical protein JXA41_04615 [Deltaproteobacteria bacterium]|nr:hypothetical protein [Deltaproteobacteria bacterium]